MPSLTATPRTVPAFPGPPPETATPQLVEYEWFPYRMVIAGPATAHAGETVTYRIDYERVNPLQGGSFVLV